ncbi:hypothetical protein EJB05_51295, partial [Eragrostis curvula]
MLSTFYGDAAVGKEDTSSNWKLLSSSASIHHSYKNNSSLKKAGGLAEFVAVLEGDGLTFPAGISAADAAGLPLAGLTALQAVKAIGTKFDGTDTGANILITAASGGIGTYTVQLAKLGNSHVTATSGTRATWISSEASAPSSDEVLDYTTQEGAAFKNQSGRKYDYTINITKDGRRVQADPEPWQASSCENYLASVLTLFSRKKLSCMVMTMKREELKYLMELVKEGKLKTVINSRHTFEEAAQCLEEEYERPCHREGYCGD